MSLLSLLVEITIGGVLLRIAETLFDSNDNYKNSFRLIYPKWLAFKTNKPKNVMSRKKYRHIRQQRKRLTIGVMIRN